MPTPEGLEILRAILAEEHAPITRVSCLACGSVVTCCSTAVNVPEIQSVHFPVACMLCWDKAGLKTTEIENRTKVIKAPRPTSGRTNWASDCVPTKPNPKTEPKGKR